MADSIDKILASRKSATEAAPVDGSDKFFSILAGEGLDEYYLELKLRDGLRVNLAYSDLSWFSYDPEGPKIDLEFGTIFVTIKGRGLDGRLLDGIKRRRVSWVKESDSEMEDNKANAVFVSEINFTVPKPEEPPPE